MTTTKKTLKNTFYLNAFFKNLFCIRFAFLMLLVFFIVARKFFKKFMVEVALQSEN